MYILQIIATDLQGDMQQLEGRIGKLMYYVMQCFFRSRSLGCHAIHLE